MNTIEERNALFLSHLPVAKEAAKIVNRRYPGYKRRDLLDQTELGLLAAASRYDPSCGVLFATYGRHRAIGAAKDWIRNNYARKKKKEVLLIADCQKEFGFTEDIPVDPTFNSVDNKEIVDLLLATLAVESRKLIQLRFLEEKTWPEVGMAFGIKDDAAKQRGIKVLRQLKKNVEILQQSFI